METNGGEGKISGRKRLRGKIGNPTALPEIKVHNLLVSGNDNLENFWTDKTVFGSFPNTNLGVWYPIDLKWPSEGSGPHQRIGRKIRVKFLRLKGYVAYSPYLITQVRYRIVLYRCHNQVNWTHSSFIVPMYGRFASMTAQGMSSLEIQNACVWNYYCAIFSNTYMKQSGIKRRVLSKGVIKPQADVPDYYNPNGTLLMSGEFQRHKSATALANNDSPANQRGFFPIDITVNMNDNIECPTQSYVIVVEADWCIGQTPQGTFGAETGYQNFYFSFIPHLYYTDD